MRFRIGLAAGLLILAVPAAAQVPAEPAEGIGAQQASALEELLDYLVAEADVIGAASTNFDAEFERNFTAGGGAAAEARFPGLISVVAAAGKQEMVAILRESYPELRASAAAMLEQALTPRDMAQANAFYGSPTGRKLTRAALDGARGQDLNAIVGSAQAAAAGAMGAEDDAALNAFASSEVFPKITVLGPRLQQSSADWATTLLTREAARLQQAVKTASAAHIASLQSAGGQ